ncbi:MAG: DNA mismatch repair endonuclease MutL [Chitinivibrionales bacterium]|nr:DNA mismatch repair endonuclease MutL [Chitinivibrionales bacterium]
MAPKKNHIELLSGEVIEKIAAGEVIERPSSVLKELLENSIDAGAHKIEISIDDAGFALVRVADDGHGMTSDDLSKCLIRYATSKIEYSDDLFAVNTLGFRGEALASIAAVSRLELVSSDTDDGLGYVVKAEGGRKDPPEPASHIRGTTIEVRDLFYNVPARKKFMKSRKAEKMNIHKLIEQVAVACPAVHFKAVLDGKPVFDLSPVESPRMRIAQIAGTGFARDLIECRNTTPQMGLVLFITPPRHASARPRYQNLYVNLRRTNNDTVAYAIKEAYSRFITSQYRPAYFCFLDIDPSMIDVNVHPTKKLVKFDDDKSLFSFVYSSLQSAVNGTLDYQNEMKPPGHELYQPSTRHQHFGVREESALFGKTGSTQPGPPQFSTISVDADGAIPHPQTSLQFDYKFDSREKQLEQKADNSIQLSGDETGAFHDLISCYQIHETYILAQIKNGILLIDQHAAHERVIYEQALADLRKERTESQQLLFPITLELTAAEKALVDSSIEYFRAFGYDIQSFSGNTIAVAAIPAFLKDSLVEYSLRTMTEYLLDENDSKRISEPEKRYASAFACGTAVRAGQKLDQEEMNGLLNSLFAAENPYTCPHGRPTVVRISMNELSRRFLR